MNPDSSEQALTSPASETLAQPRPALGRVPEGDWETRIAAVRRHCSTDSRAGSAQAAAAIEDARAHGRHDVQSTLTYLLGFSQMMSNVPHEAASSMLLAIDLARLAGRRDLEVQALSGLGAAHGQMNDNVTAIQCFEQALALLRDIPPSDSTDAMLGSLLTNMGGASLRLGAPDKAASMFRQAHELYAKAGNVGEATRALSNLASAQVDRAEQFARRGARESALDAAREARQVALLAISQGPRTGADAVTNAARLTLAGAQTLLGDHAGAAEQLRMLDADLGGSSLRAYLQAHIAAVNARVLSATGRSAEAIVHLEGELARTPPTGQSLFDRLTLLRELADVREAAGDLGGALRTFRELHDLALQARDQAAEQRGQVFNARLQVERALHDAEMERLRAQRLSLVNEELARRITVDELTGLVNRRGLDAALALRSCDPRARFACMLIDIDHFKQVNDRFSHPVGDEVLRRLGLLIRDAVRDADVAARYGGEEFALLIDRADAERALEISERLRGAVAATNWDRVAEGLEITLSIGIALRREAESADALLARADERLYAAKHAGRDTVRTDGTSG
jgi:diguanylate cyclase (GGDEF)-like protein